MHFEGSEDIWSERQRSVVTVIVAKVKTVWQGFSNVTGKHRISFGNFKSFTNLLPWISKWSNNNIKM